MQLFPFSGVGVEDMLSQLYALPDAALFIEAETIKLGFKQWINDHFVLTENQIRFLTSMSHDVSRSYAEQCSFCFLHRLDIKLISPVPPQVPGYAKWIASGSTISVKTDGTGESAISGTLTFTVSYQ
ncbi:hypothetical protein [Chryseobacterium herbae]|uniref:Uncharacterized protein n=1 Tax=Chryseobacterium herbae TaxID=2976476 RepID=A0ABT2ISN6_9FLAO|nr:hypothetical protein [Chryseobacterium sp. pc1-10]MCT2561839.1 hypothetical protein [Chryseobacterium sp. pc1-10]